VNTLDGRPRSSTSARGTPSGSVQVGLEPVAVAPPDSQVWVRTSLGQHQYRRRRVDAAACGS
jgi:hypothetical protein